MTTSTVTRPGAAARDALRAAEAPRFVEPSWLGRNGVAPDDVPGVLSDMMAEGSLSSCGEGLFANRLARPGVHPNEMVAHFGVRTYASLHTVLGEAGVANNPSRTVYAIRQSGREAGALDLRLRNGIGEYRLLAMPRDILVAGDEEDRLEGGPPRSVPCATGSSSRRPRAGACSRPPRSTSTSRRWTGTGSPGWPSPWASRGPSRNGPCATMRRTRTRMPASR
jgi:hypothetical protein